jgi:DNA-binding XRE family transcriptional regulator
MTKTVETLDPLIASMPAMTKEIEEYLIRNYHKKTRGEMAEELGIRRFHLNMMTYYLKEQGKIIDETEEIKGVRLRAGLKQCSQCREIKPLHDFHRKKKSSDGRCSYCKSCASLMWKRHYLKKK